jgi:hypothetical protein
MGVRDVPWHLVESAFDDANLYVRDEHTERGDTNAVKVWPNTYSGRGMFGDRCFGLEFENHAGLYTFLAAFAVQVTQYIEDYDEDRLAAGAAPPIDPVEFAMETRTDNMGYQMIAYWPDYSLVDFPNEDEDEEEIKADA